MLVFTTPPENFHSTMDTVGFLGIYQDTILHLLRQDHKPEGNKRSGPGGKVDVTDTTIEKALLRELQEETGIDLLQPEFTHNTLELIKTYYVRYPDRDFMYYKFRYLFDEKPQVTLREDEHKDVARFSVEEALQHELLLGEDEVLKDIYGIE